MVSILNKMRGGIITLICLYAIVTFQAALSSPADRQESDATGYVSTYHKYRLDDSEFMIIEPYIVNDIFEDKLKALKRCSLELMFYRSDVYNKDVIVEGGSHPYAKTIKDWGAYRRWVNKDEAFVEKFGTLAEIESLFYTFLSTHNVLVERAISWDDPAVTARRRIEALDGFKRFIPRIEAGFLENTLAECKQQIDEIKTFATQRDDS